MPAVYKRELRSYFCSLTGYIFIAAVVAFTGIYFMANNLSYGLPYFSYTLMNSVLIYIFVVPILTMRSFAGERRSKTDQLLITSPVGVPAIVLGKYFAMMTVFAIPLALFCVCPLIISTGGTAYFLSDYMAVICVLVIGALFVAIGMFISSLTENQIISAVITLIVLFVLYMWDNLIAFIPSSPTASLVCCIILLAVIAGCVWLLSKNKIITAIVFAAGAVALTAVGVIDFSLFRDLIPTALGSFSVISVLYNFCYYQVFDLGGLIMCLTLAAVFVFLTVRSIQKRRGGGTLLITALVIAAAVLLNLLAARLPSNIREFDVSGSKLYSVSETSKEYVSGLEEDVELILVAEKDSIDERITKFVDSYAGMSSRISVRQEDPVLSPSVLDKYECTADSLVVRSKATGKQTAIPFSGPSEALITYAFDYSSMSYQESQFDAEGQITAAIEYVTAGSSDTVYVLTGHGEAEFSASAAGMLTKANITVNDSLNLLMDGGIPEDCSLLITNCPSADLANDEFTMIREYLAKGGDIMLIMDYSNLPNFNKLMAEYGMKLEPGFAGDAEKYYAQYVQYYGYFCMAPTLSETGITAGITENALVIYPRAITLSDPARDTITSESFMTTTENGVYYEDTQSDPVTGTYVLGATAKEPAGDGTACVTVISAASLIDPNLTGSFANMSNLDIFARAAVQDMEHTSGVVIPAKSLGITHNVFDHYGILSALFIFLIPAAALVIGLAVWVRRKRR
ncbi:MAG: Gldg family protein [Oscillospiraceae bacterium]|nr:Gldg family protein [Oscillospiraceae bacterium]